MIGQVQVVQGIQMINTDHLIEIINDQREEIHQMNMIRMKNKEEKI